MTGLRFSTLEIQNFKSFGEKKTVLDFTDLPGITLFMGENEDSPDPDARNGCGKCLRASTEITVQIHDDAVASAFTDFMEKRK